MAFLINLGYSKIVTGCVAVNALDENETIRRFMYKYGLKEDETITGGLILGYPEGGKPNREPLERKGNPVTWVEK